MPQPEQVVSKHTERLVDKLQKEVSVLKSRLSETRQTLDGYRKQLDSQNRATFRLSRLIRVLETLQIPVPKDDDEYISLDYQTRAKEAVATKDHLKAIETERDIALESIRLLLGAREVAVSRSGDEETVRFVVKNDELEREMSFSIGWDDKKIEYNRISINLDQATAPQFADERCIVFDFHQGPFFLAEVLKAVHDVRLDSDKDGS